MADIIQKGVDVIMTTGAVQFNDARVTAVVVKAT
jgi:1-aminocyclopropane-1-carboxylate deaminase/D-cysteine desulfhydrase-like pyridoxal-dependent ACC family enzyme